MRGAPSVPRKILSRWGALAGDDAMSQKRRRFALESGPHHSMKALLVAGGFGVTAFGVAPRAHAETLPVEVSYSAPAGCGSRATFIAELTARTPRVRVVEAGEPGPALVVALADRPAGVVGELRLREPDGTETVRAVAGKTCEEVIPALALIAVVLVDPEATTAPATAPPSAPPPPATKPATGGAPRFRGTLGTGITLSNAVAPALSYGPFLELGLEMEQERRRGPSLTLAVERFTSPTAESPYGRADFSTLLGRITLCPWRWPQTGVAFLAPCAAFEAGALHVEASNTTDENSPTVLWAALAPVAHFELRPLRFLALTADALGIFPLVRDHFYFQPGDHVFSVPVFGWTGRFGVKALWP